MDCSPCEIVHNTSIFPENTTNCSLLIYDGSNCLTQNGFDYLRKSYLLFVVFCFIILFISLYVCLKRSQRAKKQRFYIVFLCLIASFFSCLAFSFGLNVMDNTSDVLNEPMWFASRWCAAIFRSFVFYQNTVGLNFYANSVQRILSRLRKMTSKMCFQIMSYSALIVIIVSGILDVLYITLFQYGNLSEALHLPSISYHARNLIRASSKALFASIMFGWCMRFIQQIYTTLNVFVLPNRHVSITRAIRRKKRKIGIGFHVAFISQTYDHPGMELTQGFIERLRIYIKLFIFLHAVIALFSWFEIFAILFLSKNMWNSLILASLFELCILINIAGSIWTFSTRLKGIVFSTSSTTDTTDTSTSVNLTSKDSRSSN